MADDSFNGTITIREGDNHYWEVTGAGTLKFKVDVVSGGSVDVIITDGAPTGLVWYYEDYIFTNEMHVDESFPMQEDSAFLVVDNSNEIGAHPQGDVTVDVDWELTGAAMAMFLGILIPIIIILIIVISIVVRLRRKKTTRVEYVTEDVYVDQHGRQIGVEPMGGAPVAPPTEPQWCPGCGAEMRWDAYQSRSVCAYCEPVH
jgi:hypothetical protein